MSGGKVARNLVWCCALVSVNINEPIDTFEKVVYALSHTSIKQQLTDGHLMSYIEALVNVKI